MIDIITPTIRLEGLHLIDKALKRQTMTEFRWFIGSNARPEGLSTPFEFVLDDYTTGFWTLNRIYNKLVRATSAPLIVSWQDYTAADPDALEKFLFLHQVEPKTLVTAVGNKYESVYPLGPMVWKDPRERDDQGTFYPCYFNDIEANLCSIPRSALEAVGGFDEDMDFLGFGLDAYSVFDRINDLGGYDFKINQTIKSYSLPHGRVDDWEKHNLIHGQYEKHKQELKAKGIWPNLKFLDNPLLTVNKIK